MISGHLDLDNIVAWVLWLRAKRGIITLIFPNCISLTIKDNTTLQNCWVITIKSLLSNHLIHGSSKNSDAVVIIFRYFTNSPKKNALLQGSDNQQNIVTGKQEWWIYDSGWINRAIFSHSLCLVTQSKVILFSSYEFTTNSMHHCPRYSGVTMGGYGRYC